MTEAGLRPASVTGAPHFVWGGGARARVPPLVCASDLDPVNRPLCPLCRTRDSGEGAEGSVRWIDEGYDKTAIERLSTVAG